MNIIDKNLMNASEIILLSQKREKLEKEIEKVNCELKMQQDSCNHINVCIGWDGLFPCRDTSINKCLICGEDEPKSKYCIIDASNYKKELYGHGELYFQREQRFVELQNIAINILNKNPDLSREQLAKIMKDIIENPTSSKFQDLTVSSYNDSETQFDINSDAVLMETFIEKLNVETCSENKEEPVKIKKIQF